MGVQKVITVFVKVLYVGLCQTGLLSSKPFYTILCQFTLVYVGEQGHGARQKGKYEITRMEFYGVKLVSELR